ncbi:putative indole-diterpene biosynthesis protein [Daldinia childiae]|uniref:putative indole-diterpene biosynthesis protein n=1 Tax=Daldinia childiae TaxID=326645 RepID=UPI00144710CE|nr:putative indole-diterpene biosynthesis protein [Daldinia childiae]KAF3067458.1 putative indole-diterpene biosynthesis protein [Daldinia childiae]
MASNQPATAVVKPLSMMKELTPFVYIYEPESIVTRQTTRLRVPKLIFVASWMDAQDLHIAKYITRYQAIYPTSRIILAKFVFKESMSRSLAQKTVEPAFTYLLSQLDSGFLSASPTEPEILTHVFSNGGSTTMRALYELFQSQTGRPFPLHAAVYDSCPGLFSFSPTYNVMIINFPKGLLRLIATPLVIAFVTCLWILHALRFITGENFLSVNWRVLNNLDLVKQTNRSYIYGKADLMVDWRHVEMHARQAVAKGLEVRIEVFECSPHVSHMRSDGERYWRIVTETWERTITEK